MHTRTSPLTRCVLTVSTSVSLGSFLFLLTSSHSAHWHDDDDAVCAGLFIYSIHTGGMFSQKPSSLFNIESFSDETHIGKKFIEFIHRQHGKLKRHRELTAEM